MCMVLWTVLLAHEIKLQCMFLDRPPGLDVYLLERRGLPENSGYTQGQEAKSSQLRMWSVKCIIIL